MPNFVRIVEKPYKRSQLYADYPQEQQAVMRAAYRCQFCEAPTCSQNNALNFRGMLRRVSVGNLFGARKVAEAINAKIEGAQEKLREAEDNCVLNQLRGEPVEIRAVTAFLLNRSQ